MDAIDAAVAVGVLEPVVGTAGDDRYAFVHSLTRQAVLDRLPHTRCTALHARVAQALEAYDDPALAPRIAHHYLAAHVLGHHERARHHAVVAARQAAHSLAFEEAALWFDRAATLPETPEDVRAQLSFEAATNHVRAGDFARAREIYERLTTMRDPLVRLQAAMGREEAVARPGLADSRTADLLASALADCGLDPDDPRYVRGQGSLGRALAFAGRPSEGRWMGSLAVDAARRTGDRPTLIHALEDQPVARAHAGPGHRAAGPLDRARPPVHRGGRPRDLQRGVVPPRDRELPRGAPGRPGRGDYRSAPGGREPRAALAHLLRRLPRPGAGVLPGRLRAGRAAGRGEPAARGGVRRRQHGGLLRRADVHDPPGDGAAGRRAPPPHGPGDVRRPLGGRAAPAPSALDSNCSAQRRSIMKTGTVSPSLGTPGDGSPPAAHEQSSRSR